MSQKILVAYASRAGATAGVAEEIGKVLIAKGAQVIVCPMTEVSDVRPYDAVVAGSAIQDRQWLPEAMQFLQKHQAELGKRPLATFTVCMTLAMRNGEKYRPGVLEWLAPVRRLVRPLSEGLFAGALDISKIPSYGDRLKFRLSVLFGVWSEGDHRDWEAIRAWANELYAQLLQA
jgi:menaquinone-dependent protoporphyrinogen oxidase